MKDPAVTTVGAVMVDGKMLGYLYALRAGEGGSGAGWRFVESRSGASYSHEDLVLLLGLVKSALRVRPPYRMEVVAIPF